MKNLHSIVLRGREDNPFDLIEDGDEWIKHEYESIRGSMHELRGIQRRHELYINLVRDSETSPAQLKAWKYVLGIKL